MNFCKSHLTQTKLAASLRSESLFSDVVTSVLLPVVWNCSGLLMSRPYSVLSRRRERLARLCFCASNYRDPRNVSLCSFVCFFGEKTKINKVLLTKVCERRTELRLSHRSVADNEPIRGAFCGGGRPSSSARPGPVWPSLAKVSAQFGPVRPSSTQFGAAQLGPVPASLAPFWPSFCLVPPSSAQIHPDPPCSAKFGPARSSSA